MATVMPTEIAGGRQNSVQGGATKRVFKGARMVCKGAAKGMFEVSQKDVQGGRQMVVHRRRKVVEKGTKRVF